MRRLVCVGIAAVPFGMAAPAWLGAADAAIAELRSIGITVRDLDAQVAWYRAVLGCEELAVREDAGDAVERLTGVFGARVRRATLALGEERIELAQFLAPEGRSIPEDARSDDHAFQHIAIAVADMDRAYAHLRSHRARHASTGPQTIPASNSAAAGIRAFYFKDPEGHVLEAIWFPPGKGDVRWRQSSPRLFLGIDHTAIVVADTEASLRFWRDRLGLRVAGGSENAGIEQERLNNVAGARLRITTLRAPAGPGVELLEYLAPGGGRPYPADTRANDLWRWTIDLRAGDPASLAARLRDAGDHLVSGEAVRMDGAMGWDAAFTVRDPTGHAAVVGR